jgi:aspartate/methionine/tyrosine aminotransferase
MNKLNKVPIVAEALSERARVLLEASSEGESKRKGAIQVPQGLVDSLSYHLGRGETHYPDRPGMSALRNMVGREVGKYLDGSRDGNQVLITASEGEAVFVTMLGLDLVPGGRITGEKGLHHQRLFDWLGIEVCDAEDVSISIAYRELRGGANMEFSSGRFDTEICALGDTLYGKEAAGLKFSPNTILLGSLSSLLGKHGFDLGFVSADTSVLKGITGWKQASSICAPSPSQRAALWALGERP